ncbi:unnamed protein product [Blepharisma stoltei]|uniref:Glycine cleavage system H protein n=1 Tax=Blepharisma stoltei TaxID=1481888 RepID=A0AAU9JE68_9CILI|nr:unnamed protein product [Blepharisma stoltei]
MWLSRLKLSSFPIRRFSTYFTKDHEWVAYNKTDRIGTVGITDHAQSQLGDVVHLDLPTIGAHFKQGDIIGVVESVKTVADVYSPISGKVVEVNSGLAKTPELVNQQAESDGWIAKIRLDQPGELDKLLDRVQYDKLLEEEQH